MTTDPTPSAQPPALPDRPPRSLLVHFGVDSAVAFLALVILGLIFGVPLGHHRGRRAGDRRDRGARTPVGPRSRALAARREQAGPDRERRPRARCSTPVSVHALVARSRSRATAASRTSTRCSWPSSPRSCSWPPRRPGSPRSRPRSTRTTLVGMFGASALYHRGNWSPPTAAPAAAARPHRDLPADRGHLHPDRAARDGRHRAGRHPRRGVAGRGGRHRVRVDADPRAAGLRHHASTCSSAGSARSRSSRSTRRTGWWGVGWSRAAASATPSARSCTRRGDPIPGPRRSATTRSSTCS